MNSRLSLLVPFLIFGCHRSEEISPTQGHLTVFATESTARLITYEAEEFHRTYPTVTVTVHPVSTREAIVLLLNDSASAVATDRPLNAEERSVVDAADLPVMETRIGEDALVVIVHPENMIPNILLSDLEKILTGQIRTWSQIEGSDLRGDIRLGLTGRNSGVYELLRHHFFRIDTISVSGVYPSQTDIIRYVSEDSHGIGIVSLSSLKTASDVPGKRLIRAVGLATSPGAAAVVASQSSVFLKSYPLSFSLFLYVRERKAGPGSGFATFARSLPGQKIIQDWGILPVEIPSRPIQIVEQ